MSQEATTQLSTAVTALATANSNIVGTTATDTAVSTAQAAVTAAQAAIDAALDKKDIADGLQEAAGANVTVASATDVVEDKTAVLAVAEDAVDAQVVVVDDAQTAKDAAQAVVNASTTPGLQVTVYNTQGQNNAPVVTANTPILNTYVDTNGINEQWGGGVVAGSGRVDDVVVKYEGVWTPTYTGTQYVHHAADDGTRLYLDGELISDAWYDKGGGGPTVDIETVAGQSRQFEFWYYENGGGAAVVLMRYTDSGWEVIPGTEFSISNASQAEKDALSAAVTTLNTETNILTSLEATETQAQQNLTAAQATLVLAQSAELARDEYVELAQDAIDATVEAIQVVAASTTIVNAQVAYESQPINAPTNVVVTQLSSGDVQVTWSAPETGIEPERYAISWSTGDAGWGVATGNAGDENALNTSITLSKELFASTGGLGKVYNFSVRSDQDTLARYSEATAVTAVTVLDPVAEAARVQAEQDALAASIANALAEAAAQAASASAAAAQAEAAAAAAQAAAAEAAAAEAEAAAQAAEAEAAAAEAEAAAQAEANAQAEAEAAAAEAEAQAAEEAAAQAAEEAAQAEAEAQAQAEADAQAEAEAEAAEQEAQEQAEENAAAEEAAAEAEAEAEAKDPEKQTENALEDGKVSEKEAEAVGDALAADGKVTNSEIKDVVEAITGGGDGELTKAEIAAVANVLVAAFTSDGGAVPASAMAAAGIEYKDLPPETPVETRVDANGNPVVIEAQVAADIALVTDPAALAQELFSDPAAAFAALGSIGADMSPEERKQSQEAVVATVVAAGAAIQAAAGAVAAATSTSAPSSSAPRTGGDAGAPLGKEGGTVKRKASSRRTPKKVVKKVNRIRPTRRPKP